MRIKCKYAISEGFSTIVAANWFTTAVDALHICLQIHVLQRISAMQPIVAQRNGHLEDLRLAFVLCFLCDERTWVRLLNTVRVLCKRNACVL